MKVFTNGEAASLALGAVVLVILLAWWVRAGFGVNVKATGTSFRSELPRIFELKDMVPDPSHPDAYFKNLDESLSRPENSSKRWWLRKLESHLAVLDAPAWRDLKERAAKHLQKKDPIRGWQALYDVFSEAIGYRYLRSIGCAGVRFIPRPTTTRATTEKTPDLEAQLNGLVLCEVKTINVSQVEAEKRYRMSQGEIIPGDDARRVDDKMLQKLTTTLEDGVKQLDARDAQRTARRFVFTVLHFDDWLGEHQSEYFAQIDQHLLLNPVIGAGLVFHPWSNEFNRTFVMRSATVFDP